MAAAKANAAHLRAARAAGAVIRENARVSDIEALSGEIAVTADGTTYRARRLVVAGAGHAFKFASALGRILSELVVEGTTEADLSAFTIDRKILRMANPSRSFFV